MAGKKPYVRLIINGLEADLDPDTEVPTVDYILEDDQDFEQKGAAASFDISLPATQMNDRIHNTLHDPAIVDKTANGSFDNYRPAVYLGQGQEILVGKYLPLAVTMKNGKPVRYTGKIYGQNGDWTITLKDATIQQFTNPRSHTYEQGTVQNSWIFDFYNEALDFVYAPVRYQKPFGAYPVADPDNPDGPTNPDDQGLILEDFKPSISPFWILWRGFKSAGYKIKSTFFGLQYIRRLVMPWTWGGFNLLDDTRWQGLKFVAGTAGAHPAWNDNVHRVVTQQEFDQSNVAGWQPAFLDGFVFIQNRNGGTTIDPYYPDLRVSADPAAGAGLFENNNVFSYLPEDSPIPFGMAWTYSPVVNLGVVYAGLSVQINYAYYVAANSDIAIRIEWYKNGVQFQEDVVFAQEATTLGSKGNIIVPEFKEIFCEVQVQPNDVIVAQPKFRLFTSAAGTSCANVNIQAVQLNYLKMGTGSTISLANYPKLADYKWLDLLRGMVDCFDLSLNTDPIRKEVVIEPSHAYKVDGVTYPGYYNRNTFDWSKKLDQAVVSTLQLFSDYGRELDFQFINDDQDGLLKKLQDRNGNILSRGKYVLPQRYQTDQKDITNRFFGPCVHYVHDVWSNITGKAPQLIVMVPENIANTSAPSAESVFSPKLAFYKGNVSGMGWVAFGQKLTNFPFMFAVNYLAGGETDPVLSYCDQNIQGKFAEGLLRKFFLQRMAIYRGGRRWNTVQIRLNNTDMGNFYHRESIIIDGLEYLITAISGFNPISDDSTAVTAWLFTPKTPLDDAAVFPSRGSITSGSLVVSIYEEKYYRALALASDITNYNNP